MNQLRMFGLPAGGQLTTPGYRQPTPATAQVQIEDAQAEIANIKDRIAREPWRNLGGTRRSTLEKMITQREDDIARLTKIIEKGYQP